MRTVKEVEIKQAILHKLDNAKEKPILSDFILEMPEEILTFVSTHMTRSLQDVGIRAAKYKSGRNMIRELVDGTLDKPELFIDKSKDIAQQLFTSMKANKNISSADALICFYTGNSQNYLTVLKLDYQNNLFSETRVTEDGKIRNVISHNGISLPNVKQKLQKCVFFKHSEADSEYDMVLIDKQSRSEQEKIANFFANNFLCCELADTDYSRTKKFFTAVTKWTAKEALPEDRKRFMDNMVNALKTQEAINIVEFANGLLNDEEKSKQFLDFVVTHGLNDFEFKPDKGYVDLRLKKRHIKTTDGIEINITNEDYQNKDKFEAKKIEGTDRYDIYVKNVEVTKWE